MVVPRAISAGDSMLAGKRAGTHIVNVIQTIRRRSVARKLIFAGNSNSQAMLHASSYPEPVTAPERFGERIASARPQMSKDDNGNEGRSGPGTSVITKVKPKTKKPNLYRVLILNDDYTPMEFVVHVLEKFFNKDVEAATTIMLHVHHHGIGECGVFTYEIAETKVTQVMDFARKHQHPLQCVMEKK